MFRKFLSDESAERRYVNAGSTFGNAVSYIYMGECVGFTDLLARWEKWEGEYVRRGFRTISLDTFINYGGYGEPLKGLGERLKCDEEPVFYAKIYRERYLGKVEAILDPFELIKSSTNNKSKIVTGHYFIPSIDDTR